MRPDESRFSAGLSAISGTFSINGTTIDYAASDTLQSVLQRINESGAGVIASYDAVNDHFRLTNKVTGDIGFALSDLSGNFLEATRLFKSGDGAVGSLVRGANAEFTVNGGGTQANRSNSLTSASHGIEGLTVNLASAGNFPGDFILTVGKDTGTVKTALAEFVDQYNKTQGLIETLGASSTDAKGTVTEHWPRSPGA